VIAAVQSFLSLGSGVAATQYDPGAPFFVSQELGAESQESKKPTLFRRSAVEGRSVFS
jgi:hypothetical protein